MAFLHRLTLPLLMAVAFAASGCAYNADLGRDQLLIVGDDNLAAEGEKAWAETLRSGNISREPIKVGRVRAIGQRVIEAAGMADRPWDYAVFLDEAPNAFVLPGGHVGVTVGLLAVVENDDQLAAVIGHEAGHVVARHAAERISQQRTSAILLASPARRRAAATLAGWSRTMAAPRPSSACCCRSRASRSWRPTSWASTTCSGPAIARARR